MISKYARNVPYSNFDQKWPKMKNFVSFLVIFGFIFDNFKVSFEIFIKNGRKTEDFEICSKYPLFEFPSKIRISAENGKFWLVFGYFLGISEFIFDYFKVSFILSRNCRVC